MERWVNWCVLLDLQGRKEKTDQKKPKLPLCSSPKHNHAFQILRYLETIRKNARNRRKGPAAHLVVIEPCVGRQDLFTRILLNTLK